MKKESWRSNRGGGIMEDASWRTHHAAGHPGITRRYPGGTEEEPGRTQDSQHLEGTKEAFRRLQEAPRILSAETEQPPKRHPRHPKLLVQRPARERNSNHSQLKLKS